MTRSERLFRLLDLLESDKKIPMSKITAACTTSARTVYRDIRTLTNLGYTINAAGGYSLASPVARPLADQFNDLELRLIRFALETHQLGNVFPFSDIAARLATTTPLNLRIKLKAKSELTLGKEEKRNRLSGHAGWKSRWLAIVSDEEESKK